MDLHGRVRVEITSWSLRVGCLHLHELGADKTSGRLDTPKAKAYLARQIQVARARNLPVYLSELILLDSWCPKIGCCCWFEVYANVFLRISFNSSADLSVTQFRTTRNSDGQFKAGKLTSLTNQNSDNW